MPLSQRHLRCERRQRLDDLKAHTREDLYGFPLAEWYALHDSVGDGGVEAQRMGDVRLKLSFSELAILPEMQYKSVLCCCAAVAVLLCCAMRRAFSFFPSCSSSSCSSCACARVCACVQTTR